jgi:hypothetical protein
MTSLLNLPLRAVAIATAPTRFAIRVVWSLLSDGDEEAAAAPAHRPAAAREEPEPPARPAARPRRPTAATPSPKAARRATRGEPTRGQAANLRQAAREAESPSGPGPTIEVSEPWPGYAGMTEDQILDRLTGADPTLRAAVRLYESFNDDRRQVLIATEETLPQP